MISFNENLCLPSQTLNLENKKVARSQIWWIRWVINQFESQFVNFCHGPSATIDIWNNAIILMEQHFFLLQIRPYFFNFGLQLQVMMRNSPPLLFYLFQDSRWTQFHDYPKKQSPSISRPMKPFSSSSPFHSFKFTLYNPLFWLFLYLRSEIVDPSLSTVINQYKKFDSFRSNRALEMFIRMYFWFTIGKRGTQCSVSLRIPNSSVNILLHPSSACMELREWMQWEPNN